MLAPKPAYFWDDATNSWRKAVVGEAGEYVWNNTTNAWEFGTIGAEYLYNHSTKAWDFGPGGQYVYNHSTKSWDKVTEPGYGGQYYWDTTTNSWVRNANAASASDAFARWDFLTNQAWWDGDYVGALANTPNWTFTRASTGYAQTAAGVLVPFASGELRRTDKGVLIEGARTNLCLQSQTFDNASWTKNNVALSAATDPAGGSTAFKVTENDTAAGTQHDIRQNITIAAGATYTASIYAKAGSGANRILRVYSDGGGSIATTKFDLSNGTVYTAASTSGNWTGASSTITALANGWYRCTLTWTATTDAGTRIIYWLYNASNTSTYDGDGTSHLYLWGAQLEAASFPSSYIPTTTASATRAADSLTVTGVTGLDYPLTLFAEFERSADTGAPEGLIQVDTATNDRAVLTVSSGDLGHLYVQDGGVDQVIASAAGAMAVGTVYKAAARISLNDSIVARGGTLSAQDTSCTMPDAPTSIRLGNQNGVSSPLFGYLRRLAVYASAKTDAQLQAMTS